MVPLSFVTANRPLLYVLYAFYVQNKCKFTWMATVYPSMCSGGGGGKGCGVAYDGKNFKTVHGFAESHEHSRHKQALTIRKTGGTK